MVGITPRPWAVCARWGEREDTWQEAGPSCGRSALAGARGRTPGRQHAPAGAGLCTPEREGGHLAGNMPRLWLVCAGRGERGDTSHAARPGCGQSAHDGARGRTLGRQHAPCSCGRSTLAGARGRTPGRQHALAVAGLRTPGRGRSYLAAGRPGCSLSTPAGAGGRTLGRQHGPAVAGLRTPGWEKS